MKSVLIVTDAWHPQINGVVRSLERVTEVMTARGKLDGVPLRTNFVKFGLAVVRPEYQTNGLGRLQEAEIRLREREPVKKLEDKVSKAAAVARADSRGAVRQIKEVGSGREAHGGTVNGTDTDCRVRGVLQVDDVETCETVPTACLVEDLRRLHWSRDESDGHHGHRN